MSKEIVLNEFTKGKRGNDKLNESSYDPDIVCHLEPSDYFAYNEVNIPIAKFEVLYNSMKSRAYRFEFGNMGEFEHWLYKEQTTYRASKSKSKDKEYCVDYMLFGNGVANGDTVIFVPPQIKNMITYACKLKNTELSDLFGVSQDRANNTYKGLIRIIGSDQQLKLITTQNKLLAYAVTSLCRDKYYQIISKYCEDLGLINRKTYLRLKDFSKIPLEEWCGKFIVSQAEEYIEFRNLFTKIIKAVGEFSYPVFDEILKDIIPVEKVNKIDIVNKYRQYIRKHMSINRVYSIYSKIYGRSSGGLGYVEHANRTYQGVISQWKTRDEFADWFFNVQTSYICKNRASIKHGDNSGYVIDKDLFYNGTYGPESCVFMPHILNDAISVNYGGMDKTSGLPIGVRFKDGKYRVVLGMLGSAGGAGERICTLPDYLGDDIVDVGFIIYMYCKTMYVHMMAKELYKRNLIPRSIYQACMKWKMYDPSKKININDRTKKLAFEFMKQHAPGSGTRSYTNYFSKMVYLFNKNTLPKIDEFESILIKPEL